MQIARDEGRLRAATDRELATAAAGIAGALDKFADLPPDLRPAAGTSELLRAGAAIIAELKRRVAMSKQKPARHRMVG